MILLQLRRSGLLISMSLGLLLGCSQSRARNEVSSKGFQAHAGRVTGLALSADGRQALSCGADGWIRHWELPSGRLLRAIGPLKIPEEAVAFAGQGRWAVSAGYHEGGGLSVWDLGTGALRLDLNERTGSGSFQHLRRLAVSEDGLQALSPGRNNALVLWDLQTGAQLGHYYGHWANIAALSFGGDGSTFPSAGEDGEVMLHARATGQLLQRHQFQSADPGVGFCHGGAILSKSGKALLEASSSGDRLQLLDLQTGTQLKAFAGHTGPVKSIAVDAQEGRAVSGGVDGAVCWDLESGSAMAVLPGSACAVAMDPQGRFALVGQEDGCITLLPWPRQGRLATTAAESEVVSVHRGGLNGLAFAPDGKTLWVAEGPWIEGLAFPSLVATRSILVHEELLAPRPPDPYASTGLPPPALARLPMNIKSLAVSPDGKTLLTGELDPDARPNGIRLWEAATGAQLQHYRSGNAGVRFSFDGRQALSWNVIGYWDTPGQADLQSTDLATGTVTVSPRPRYSPNLITEVWSLITTQADPPDEGTLAEFSGDARWILIAFKRLGKVALWDRSHDREQKALGFSDGPVSALALSPAADLAAYGDGNGRLCLKSTFNGRTSLAIQGSQAGLTALMFTPDGQGLISGDKQGRICLWDTQHLTLKHTFLGAIREVGKLALSPDGHWLVATDPQGCTHLHVWKMCP